MQNRLERQRILWLQTAMAIALDGAPVHAARRLGISVATAYRHADSLERALGLRLFDRHHAGWSPRKEARSLLSAGRQIDQLLSQAHDDLLDRVRQSQSNLRIAVSEDFATHYVARRLASFRSKHPTLTPVLDVSSGFSDLVNGAADVAIRPHMEPGDNLVGRRVGKMRHAFYASDGFVARCGRPHTLADLPHFDVCGYAAAIADYSAGRWLDRLIGNSGYVATFGSTAAMMMAVQEGVGIGLLPCFSGDAVPGLQRVLAIPDGLPLDIWLVTASANRKRPKVRAFMQFFAAAIKADDALFQGRP